MWNWHHLRWVVDFFTITAPTLTQLMIKEENLPNAGFTICFFKGKGLNIHTDCNHILYSSCLICIILIGPSQSFWILYYFLCHHSMSSPSPSIFTASLHYYNMRIQTFSSARNIQYFLIHCISWNKEKEDKISVQRSNENLVGKLKKFFVMVSKKEKNLFLKAFLVSKEIVWGGG